MVSSSKPLPHEQFQPQPANYTIRSTQPNTQQREGAPTEEGRQVGQGQTPNRGEPTVGLRGPMAASHTAQRQYVTVEEGPQGRPRGTGNSYPGPLPNQEEENNAEQEGTRPSKAANTRNPHSNQVRLFHEKTMQTREGEPELERAKEMTVEGNGGIVYDTNPPPQGAPP